MEIMTTKIKFREEAARWRRIIRKNKVNLNEYSNWIGDRTQGVFFELYNDTLDREDKTFANKQIQLEWFINMTKHTGRSMSKNNDGSMNLIISVLLPHPSISRSRSIQTMTQWFKHWFWVLNGIGQPNEFKHNLMKLFLHNYAYTINTVYSDSEPFVITELPCNNPCEESFDMAGVWKYYLPEQLTDEKLRITSLHKNVRIL